MGSWLAWARVGHRPWWVLRCAGHESPPREIKNQEQGLGEDAEDAGKIRPLEPLERRPNWLKSPNPGLAARADVLTTLAGCLRAAPRLST